MLANFLSVQPLARSQHAEVIAQLVREHPPDQRVRGDASVLVPADDGRQIEAFVEIIDHQHGADGKRFILVRSKLSRPQLCLFLHNSSIS